MEHSSEYEQGKRDGKLASLEKSVSELTSDVKTLKVSVYMVYGAIALVQLLPELRGFFNGGN